MTPVTTARQSGRRTCLPLPPPLPLPLPLPLPQPQPQPQPQPLSLTHTNPPSTPLTTPHRYDGVSGLMVVDTGSSGVDPLASSLTVLERRDSNVADVLAAAAMRMPSATDLNNNNNYKKKSANKSASDILNAK